MPQQVLASPKAPDNPIEQRSQREREYRVRADAGVFGSLLGALQAGEAGIVRGEARNDSAAEWNAKDAREHRQESRGGAQESSPIARESRDALARLSRTNHHQPAQPTPVASASDESSHQPSTDSGQTKPNSPSMPSKPEEGSAAPAERIAAQPAQVSPARPHGVVATAGVQVSAASAPSTPSGANLTSQATAVEAARGPRGGAARGGAPAPPSPNAERALRFEKVFEAQLGRGLAQALRSGDSTVTLRLRPANLGQLSVQVRVEQSRVTATFEARSVEAHRLLEASRDSLRLQLESRGLSVDRIDVRLAEDAGQTGTRLAMASDGGADGGQDGRGLSDDRGGRGAPEGDGTDGQSRRGALREDDEPAAGAEPWRALGTVRLNAIA